MFSIFGKAVEGAIDAVTGKNDVIRDVYSVKRDIQFLGDAVEIDKAQIELNSIDAKSGSWFNSGWRPALGYVCSFGLLLHIVIFPLLNYFLIVGDKLSEPLIVTDKELLITVVVTLLGGIAYRSYEKTKKLQFFNKEK